MSSKQDGYKQSGTSPTYFLYSRWFGSEEGDLGDEYEWRHDTKVPLEMVEFQLDAYGINASHAQCENLDRTDGKVTEWNSGSYYAEVGLFEVSGLDTDGVHGGPTKAALDRWMEAQIESPSDYPGFRLIGYAQCEVTAEDPDHPLDTRTAPDYFAGDILERVEDCWDEEPGRGTGVAVGSGEQARVDRIKGSVNGSWDKQGAGGLKGLEGDKWRGGKTGHSPRYGQRPLTEESKRRSEQPDREQAWCEWLLNGANHLDGTQAASCRRRAEQGAPEAQLQFARLLKEGAGVRLNRVTAYKWLELAASQTADENIHGRASTVRRLMALEMTPAEVAEGQRLAAAWHSAPGTTTSR